MAPGALIVHPFMPPEEAIWEDFCRVVREELKGLKEIRVWIRRDGLITNIEAETRMLAPLKGLKGVEIVEMRFPWYEDESADNNWRKIAST